MKILKYKKNRQGKYIVYLDDGRELILYEEVILKYDLLLTREVLDSQIEEINNVNFQYDVYYVALKSIENRFKSTYDLITFLKNKEYPDDLIEMAIDKLTKQGYLNDRSFAKSYINSQMNTTSHGPNRIIGDLINKKIDQDIIDEEILVFTEDIQIEKIRKIIDKGVRSNRTRGGVILKNKIVNDLKNYGYDYSLISRVISEFDFSCDLDLAKKEYDKLYKKYSSKYSGYELKQKIREKLFQKGLSYEEEQ